MTDLSVVILNWKVKDLLRRCLASIYREARGIAIEVIVVDNDSRDGSVEMVLKEFPQATVIANNRNLGFAAGNNPAIARATGEFIMLLNPDTEVVGDALSKLVAFMRRTPQAGICGPKLLNADGSFQPSVRRFPTFASQAMIALKAHHVFPRAAPLRRYFAADFDYGRASQADQVMGAAFVMRRSMLEAVGALDERFFIWFEEVDLCKRAVSAGFQVWYTPEASVIHRGGESFGQVFGPQKQRMFNASMRAYFLKHHGPLPYLALLALHPVSMALAWGAEGRRAQGGSETMSTFRTAFILFLFLEVLSFFGFLFPTFSTAAFLIIVVLAAALSLVRFDLAVTMLLAELFVGSQGGYLVSFGPGGGGPGHGIDISLRLGLFLVVFGVWAGRTASAVVSRDADRRRAGLDWLWLMRRRRLLAPYLALLGIFALGLVIGVLRGNDLGNVFFDANGYAFFALFPAVIAVMADPRFRERLPSLLMAAVAVAVLKALFVLYVFSHRMFFVAPYVYVWVRDTRVGEITKMVGDFYRVFLQSHVFALTGFFAPFLAFVYAKDMRSRQALAAAAAAGWMLVGVIMGFSRSFWFGAFGAVLLMAAIFVWSGAAAVVWKRAFGYGVVGVFLAAAVIMAVYSIPFPRKGDAISFGALLGGRAFSLSGEAAANSRWALLPELWRAGARHPIVGSGLGTTVTYTTSDPRLLATNPTGEYTTYAFEWGYHDLWVKFGLIGLAAYAWLLWAIAKPVASVIKRARSLYRDRDPAADPQKEKAVFAAGLLLGLVALLATNVFSPYLNHPLGIGLVMLFAGYGAAMDEEKTAPSASL